MIISLFVWCLFIILFFLTASLWGFYSSIHPPKIISKITPQNLGFEYEKVSFTTSDDVKLSGWFIPSKNKQDAKTIVLLHGYPADKGDILSSLIFLNEKYNLFLFDFRYFGESEGKFSTAGALEVDDLISAVKYLQGRGIKEVGVWGFSMGGAVALMSASLTPEIKAVVSESSYASLDKMTKELYVIPFLKTPLGYFTSLWARAFFGINTSKVSPAISASKLNIPVLVIHSKNDEVISFENAQILEESLKNNSKAQFWFEDNLIHGQLNTDYQNRLIDFFDNSL